MAETSTDVATALASPYVLRVNLPGAPNRDLGPNGRLHWIKRYKLIEQARHDARYALMGQTIFSERQHLASFPRITLHVIAPRRAVALRMDDDNVWGCLKPYRDQLAETLGVNDRIMRCGTVTWDGKSGETVIIMAGDNPATGTGGTGEDGR